MYSLLWQKIVEKRLWFRRDELIKWIHSHNVHRGMPGLVHV